jgi:hypothetical protein
MIGNLSTVVCGKQSPDQVISVTQEYGVVAMAAITFDPGDPGDPNDRGSCDVSEIYFELQSIPAIIKQLERVYREAGGRNES